LHDLDEADSISFALKDLPKHVEKFGFILGIEKRTFRDQDPVNIAASELMGKLHDALLAESDPRLLNSAQKAAIEDVLTSPDRIRGLQGLAGTGKTTVLESIREGAERNGYTVEGFAPSSRAAGQLREAGIGASTLQSLLVKGGTQAQEPASRHLYMLDESSLASTKQMRAFLDRIGPEDRVLVIGDTRQHQAVDAGRPFQQMQEAGEFGNLAWPISAVCFGPPLGR